MLDAAELALLQSDAVAAVLDKSADIYHKVTTADAYGTPVDTWPTKAATVPAGLAEPSGNELANFDYLIGDKVAWKLHTPIGTDLREQDHVVIEGQTIEVHVILTPQSYPVLLDAIVAEIKER